MNSPMLCQPWDERPKPGQWIVEPKIDGVRALIEIDSNRVCTIYSRNGKPLYNWHLIRAELQARRISNVVLDGEIYDGRSFDSTSGILRTQYKHPDAARLTYHVFDVIVPGITPTLATRKSYLQEALPGGAALEKPPCVRLLPWLVCKPGVAWEIYIKGMHKLGHEGAVFKLLDSQYEYKRSGAWYKAKPTYDADLLIVGMQKGEGKYFDTLGALIVAGEVYCKGVKTFVQCNLSGMDDAMRDWFWNNRLDEDLKIIGRMIVQVEFQNVTTDGSLRFPRFVRIREDKV